MKTNTQLWLIVLGVLLIFAIGYIAFDKYQEARDKDRLDVYEAGVQFGYEQAVVQLMTEVSRCQPVPLYAGNQTIDVIAVACLEQGAQ